AIPDPSGKPVLRPVYIEPEMIGHALPWDVYTETGVLVAPAGAVIADERHYLNLTERLLFRDAGALDNGENPLLRLSEMGEEAEEILTAPEPERLTELLEGLLSVYDADPDACLGYVLRVPLARPSVRHSLHVLFVAVSLAQHLDFGEAEQLSLAGAALTMNLGALDLHDSLYGRRGPPLVTDRETLQSHPLRAAELLDGAGIDDETWLESVRQHHENVDGSGYPAALAGADIGKGARILRVADIYCAKVTGRYYRPPRSPRYALEEIFGSERRCLDAMVTNVLLRRMGIYPPGTLVRLANFERACVARRVRDGVVRRVVSFLDAHDMPMDPPRERNVTRRATAIRGFVEEERRWPRINWPAVWGY
ncbi:MAG: HD domain-containing phosphohydrolase, partial [Acidihalobacter sp.]